MNQKEELVLKIISSVNVIRGKTKFVKILHFVCKLFEKNKRESPFVFRPDNFGAYSTELEPVLENLQSQRYVNISSPLFSKRNDLSLLSRPCEFQNKDIIEMSLETKTLVRLLNPYTADEVIAFSYYLFPEMSVNSKIKPMVNKKIEELFSVGTSYFDESLKEGTIMNSNPSESLALYPQFNDIDVRMNMMKSLGLKKLPPIIPDSIDDSSGIIAKESSFLKEYNLEKILKNVRRR